MIEPILFDNFQAANVVIGQANSLGGLPNQGGAPDANTLNNPFGLLQITNGRLFLGDTLNNRVLAFDTLPTLSNSLADFVLGQADFTTTTANTTQGGMRSPKSIATYGGKMIVADFANHRILIYNTLPADGTALPDVVVGQADFLTRTPSCDSDSLGGPETATVTPGGQLIVADTGNQRVLIWNALPATNGQAADIVLGQGDMTHCTANDDDQNNTQGAPTARTFWNPAGVWADNTRLVVLDSDNHRALIWTTFPSTDFQPADMVLGQADFTHNASNDDDQDGFNDANPTARTLNLPFGGVHFNGEKLAVADSDNNRVLIWYGFPTSNFQAADIVIGQGDFTHNTCNDNDQDGFVDANPTSRTLCQPYAVLFYDDKLLVADNLNHRVLIHEGYID